MAAENEKEALADHADEKEPLKNGDPLADGNVVVGGTGDATADLDSSRARFIKDKDAHEAYIDIEGKTSLEENFVGLTKEELAEFANDPFWKKVRLALLILFWVAWVAMLAAAIAIIILAPKCPPRPKLDWWQTSVVYEAYPRSFKDAKGEDGIGDLKGIHDKLDYLRDTLNVSAVWMNPIYPSPNKDFGYDVSDYVSINPEFGTMEEFENLRIAMHKKGMKVILDFVPNHSSDEHPWFLASKNGSEQFKDYYVWHNGGGSAQPPNNWRSAFGGSAWTWVEKRGQWYLHQFSESQPDLNLRNEEVQKELEAILRFWLDKGVDGFRVGAAARLIEAEDFADEPVNGMAEENDYKNYDHIYTTLQPETYEVITKWREILDEYSEASSKPRFIMVEIDEGTHNQTAQFTKYGDKPGAHMIINTNLLELNDNCRRADCIISLISKWSDMAENHDLWSNWQVGNHDSRRITSRIGQDWMKAVNMMLLTLPGTPITYYGDELSMRDVNITFEQAQDPFGIKWGQEKFLKYSRDPERTPMQWSDDANAGFCKNGTDPWLPVAADYKTHSVKTEQAHGAGITDLEVFAKLATLRQAPSFQWGDLQAGISEDVLFYIRQAEGFPGFLVAINFGPGTTMVDFVAKAPEGARVPPRAKIIGSTYNFEGSRADDFRDGEEARLNSLLLEPKEGVIFEWPVEDIPKKEEL